MTRRPTSAAASFFLPAAATLAALAAPGVASGEQILFTEFFEEVYALDSETGALTDLVDTPTGGTDPFGQHLVVAGDGAVYVSDFGDLYRFDAGAADPYTLVVDRENAPFREVVRGVSGLVAVDFVGGEILTVDPLTGGVSTLYDETFFSASDVAVDAGGRVFATEFFGGLGYLDAGASDFVEIGDFDPLDLDHLDIGADGQIYASTGFDDGFVRIDPSTGRATDLLTDAYDSIDDLRVSDDNELFFAGRVAGEDGVFRLVTAEDGSASVLAVTTGGGLTFFNPQDLDFGVSSLRATVVPEPTGLLALAAVGGLATLRRRRG